MICRWVHAWPPVFRWTARFAYSFTKRGREDFFAERDPTLSNWIALWRAKDDKGRLANGNTIEQEITGLRDVLDDNTAANAGHATGSRPPQSQPDDRATPSPRVA